MTSTLAIGTLGRTLCQLSPSGEVEVHGNTHPARTSGEDIEAGRDIFVTGMDSLVLIVRSATPNEMGPPAAARSGLKRAIPFGTVLMVLLFVLSVCYGLLAAFHAVEKAKVLFPLGAAGVVGWLIDLMGGLAVAAVLATLGELLRRTAPLANRRTPRE